MRAAPTHQSDTHQSDHVDRRRHDLTGVPIPEVAPAAPA